MRLHRHSQFTGRPWLQSAGRRNPNAYYGQGNCRLHPVVKRSRRKDSLCSVQTYHAEIWFWQACLLPAWPISAEKQLCPVSKKAPKGCGNAPDQPRESRGLQDRRGPGSLGNRSLQRGSTPRSASCHKLAAAFGVLGKVTSRECSQIVILPAETIALCEYGPYALCNKPTGAVTELVATRRTGQDAMQHCWQRAYPNSTAAHFCATALFSPRTVFGKSFLSL